MSEPVVLAIDTATTRIVVATGATGGEMRSSAEWPAGYRHGETLLPAIQRLLDENGGLAHAAIAGIIVGTGPGAFTGLRVGLATAKGLAYGLRRPIVGVSTGAALLSAAAETEGVAVTHVVLFLPAGPTDRIMVRAGAAPSLLPAGQHPSLHPDAVHVAVDLEGRAPDDALERGERARAGLAARLLALGSARLRVGDTDDLARLVPDYVTLPRGAGPPSGEMAWSRDPR